MRRWGLSLSQGSSLIPFSCSGNLGNVKVTIGADTVESSEIVLVGEYATSPSFDLDEFCLVVVTADGKEFAVPSGIEFQGVLEQLQKALAPQMRSCLLCGADFVSRVMFPPELEGKPFYRCMGDVNAHLRRGWLSRWWHNPLVIWELDDEVVQTAIGILRGRA